MGIWKAKILTSKKGETGELEKQLAKLLNDGWEIKGYSVYYGGPHYTLLVKET